MIGIPRGGGLLRRLVRVSTTHPLVTIGLSLGLAALGISYTASALTFKSTVRHLLPAGQRYVTLYNEYTADFGELEDIVVVVQGRTPDESKAYAARLDAELRKSPIPFERIAYRIDPARFEGRALLFLSVDKLKEVRDRILDHQELMESFAAAPSLDRLIDGINQGIGRAFIGHIFDLGLEDSGTSSDLRFLRELLAQISERMDHPRPYRSPWGTVFSFGRADENSGYFFSEDKSLLFMLIEPPDLEPTSRRGSFTGDQASIEEIRTQIGQLRGEFPEVQVGVTGAPTLANDERSTALRDGEVATVLAFGLTLGLLLLAFRRAGKPVLMLGALAVSLAWSMGLVTLTVGHLTIFSVMFISIVVGIGIDYGIYFLYRYEEELSLGRTVRAALGQTAAWSGPGILLGALTAAATFFVLLLTDFRGIQEFGFISATALLMAFLSMLTLFPALLVLVDGRRPARRSGVSPDQTRVPALERIARHPRPVLLAAGLLTGFSLWAIPTVSFDYDLLNLQAKGTESVIWERKILATAKRSGFTAFATATSLSELRQKQAAFERLPSVSEADSVLRLIPEGQPAKLHVIRQFAPAVAPVRVGEPRVLDLDRLIASLETLKRRLDLAVSEAVAEGPGATVQEVRAQLDALLERLRGPDRAGLAPGLNDFQADLYGDFRTKFQTLQRNLNPPRVTVKDVPDELRRKFIGQSGRFLIRLHPDVNIWDREGATRFVEELRAVDPDVTGSAVINYETIRLMERAYRRGTLYAFVLVTTLALLMIRRGREICVALIPLALGTLWTVGLMHLLDLKFNSANVWGLPLIIGAAAEYGLNVVVRVMEARATGGPLLARSTAMAVLLNGLTTIAGFGSLLVTHHQGIWSLGLLLTIGSCASLVAALVVLPALLPLVSRPSARDPARALSARA